MFFVQCDARILGKTYTVRVGKMTTNFDEAVKKARARQGYIVDEHRKLRGQCVDAGAPLYVGELRKINISSGEDACHA